jgi:hypothetical protein
VNRCRRLINQRRKEREDKGGEDALRSGRKSEKSKEKM